MRLVVDTNILFSFFKKDSFTKRLIENEALYLLAPTKALEELRKYKKEISEKASISSSSFESILQELQVIVHFVDSTRYRGILKEAQVLSPDKNDAEFFAVCLQENLLLWSNDRFLTSQNKIKVIKTKELVHFLEY